MHPTRSRVVSFGQRYSAKNIVKPIVFHCAAPQAREVFIMGDFNDWDPKSHPLQRQVDGGWRVQVPLNHGHHHYLFLVDGHPSLDPNAQGTARNHEGQNVSLLAVS